MHRRAIWLLVAAAALPSTPLLAQDQPVTGPPITVPPVNLPDPIIAQPPVTQPPITQPPVTQTSPPVTTSPRPAATTPTPITEAPAAPVRRATTRTARTTRAAPQPRVQASARQAAPAVAAVAAAPAAAPAAPVAQTAAPAAPAVAPAPLPVPEATPAAGLSIWIFLVGGALLLLAAFALFQMRRHRRRADGQAELHDEAPIAYGEPAPLAAAPATLGAAALAAHGMDERREIERTPAVETHGEDVTVASAALHEAAEEPIAVADEVAVAEADPADVEALAAGSVAPDGRPWLEFLMRPVRAGTSKDAAVVEFELTVSNTGSLPARDVRISTFMFAAGSAQESEMERMLIDPPADAVVTEVDIEAGDATRVDTSMALPKDALSDEPVLPVVVANARYRLPDGSEGRTRASFEVGIPSADGLDPFPMDRTSGLLEGVEARLHGEPERV